MNSPIVSMRLLKNRRHRRHRLTARQWLGRIGYGILIGFLLFVLGLQVADYFIQFRMSDVELKEFYARDNVHLRIQYYKVGSRTMRFMRSGNKPAATILFIHGAPSSLSYYRDYLRDSLLLREATLIAVDRAGYGYSELGRSEPDIQRQAALIAPVLTQLHRHQGPVIVVGASFGAPIAARLVMDNPGLAQGLVLVAPPLKPGAERVFWFSPFIENDLLQPLVPRMLRVANTEKLAHATELKKMLPLWPRIRIPTAYLQGANDNLVYTSNEAFAREKLAAAPLISVDMIPGRGHLIAYNEHARIRQRILDVLAAARRHGSAANNQVAKTPAWQ